MHNTINLFTQISEGIALWLYLNFSVILYLAGYYDNSDHLQDVYDEEGGPIDGNPDYYSIDGEHEPNDGEGKHSLNIFIYLFIYLFIY